MKSFAESPWFLARPARCLAWVFFGWLALACGAVFPDLSTPLRQPPPNFNFDPPPPSDLYYLEFLKAVIPDKTRDGRAWDSVGGSLPDPFGKLIVDETDLIVTPVQSNTLTPTWPNQKRGNYRVHDGTRLRVELWDSNPIANHPICSQEIKELKEQVSSGSTIEVSCDSGAFIRLLAEPAHGKIGLGFSYEIQTDAVYVVKVFEESPAARAGIRRGEQITAIMGATVKDMPEGRVRSLINANGSTGLKLGLRAVDHSEREVIIKDGPVYPLLDEGSL